MGTCNSPIEKKDNTQVNNKPQLLSKQQSLQDNQKTIQTIEVTLIYEDKPLFTNIPFLLTKRLNEVIDYSIKHNYLNAFSDYQIHTEQNGIIDITEKSKELLCNIFTTSSIMLYIQYTGLKISKNITNDYAFNTPLISIPYLDSYDPLAIALFNKVTKTFNGIAIEPSDDTIDIFKTLSYFSAYCNGNNHLYISGGFIDDKKDNQDYSNHFLSITLNENNAKTIVNILPSMKIGRSWHTMIYIPPDYIFIVSGLETKIVEKYTISSNSIDIDSELNEIRCETSLCCINNAFLYSFCGYMRNYGFLNSIEKCNLRKVKRTWKIVNYNLLNNCIFSPSFFPLAYSSKDNSVILFGVNETKSNAVNNYSSYKFSFNPINNANETIEYSDEYSNNNHDIFPEKMFIPIDDNISISMPIVINDSIKVYNCDFVNKRLSVDLYAIPLVQINKTESD